MKRIVAAAMFAALVGSAVFQEVHAEPYALRVFTLGMTLEEFRATPFPDPDQFPETNILCSGDPVRSTVGSHEALEVTGALAQIGVIRCNYFRPSRIDSLARQGFRDGANLQVANIGVYQLFEFVPDPQTGTPRLFRIQIDSNMRNWDQFLAAYTEKFGPPSGLTNTPVQNGLGAVFDKITARWQNAESSITLRQRSGGIDLMAITYELDRLASHVARAIQQIDGKPADNL